MCHHPTIEQVAEAIVDLFDPADEHLLLTSDGSAYGSEGLAGLRLVGNCAFDAFFRRWEHAETRLIGAARPRAERAALRRLARVRRDLRALRAPPGGWYVL